MVLYSSDIWLYLYQMCFFSVCVNYFTCFNYLGHCRLKSNVPIFPFSIKSFRTRHLSTLYLQYHFVAWYKGFILLTWLNHWSNPLSPVSQEAVHTAEGYRLLLLLVKLVWGESRGRSLPGMCADTVWLGSTRVPPLAPCFLGGIERKGAVRDCSVQCCCTKQESIRICLVY